MALQMAKLQALSLENFGKPIGDKRISVVTNKIGKRKNNLYHPDFETFSASSKQNLNVEKISGITAD